MNKKLRILFSSNIMTATSGYSQQMLMLLPQIRDAGYPVAISNFYGQEGGIFELNGIKMYPKIGDTWGGDAMVMHGKDFKADITITFQDIWVLKPYDLQNVIRFCPWVPIDHDPPPQAVLDRCKLAYRLITHSKFGHDRVEKAGLYSTYIPLTVDTNIYKPLGEKGKYKKMLNIPEDMFLFGMISANKDNPSRKSFQEVMDAFKMFNQKHPKSGIYFHCMLEQQGGFPIKDYAKFIGIEKSVFHIEAYDYLFHVDRPALCKIINAFDCLCAPSSNEGFGVPIIENQSCGIPVITNNFTSMPELIIPGKTGLLTTVAFKRFTPIGSWIGIPDVTSIYNCMEEMYKKDRVKMGEEARKYILENYDSDLIFKTKWLPFLSTIEKEIYHN